MRPALVTVPALLLTLALSAACGSSAPTPTVEGDAGAPLPPSPEAAPPAPTDAGTDTGKEPPPALAPVVISFPQAVSAGGKIVTAPKVVNLYFGAYRFSAEMDRYNERLGTSTFWPSVATEYGIGPLVARPSVTFDEAAPTRLSDAEVQAWLVAKLDGTTALGEPDPDTLYAIYYPQSTTIVDQEGGQTSQSCRDYGGYHAETNVRGTRVGYTVLPDCGGGHGMTAQDQLTIAASHEYFEWASDPFPYTDMAYAELDADHWVWTATTLGELGDICTALDNDFPRPADLGYAVQRMWSNKLAKEGHFPCAPRREIPYFVGMPAQNDTVRVPSLRGRGTVSTKGIRVPKQGSVTVDLLFYSDQAGKSFSIDVFDAFGDSGAGAEFSYKLDKSSGTAGDHARLTVTANRGASIGAFFVRSRSGALEHLWPALVVVE